MKRKRGQNRSFSLCIFFPKNCKGSHVGMILAFVIFITFILFLYNILRPAVNVGRDKRLILEYIENEIVKNVSNNFTSASVSISGANPLESCVAFEDLLIIPEFSLADTIVKNELNEIQSTDSSFSNLIVYRGNQENLFFRLFFSPEFDIADEISLPSECSIISKTDYTLGLVKLDHYIFEQELINLIDFYDEHYESLKENFGIVTGNDFAFSFIESDGNKIDAEQDRTSIDIYADEIPIQYVDSEANIKSGFLNIRVW